MPLSSFNRCIATKLWLMINTLWEGKSAESLSTIECQGRKGQRRRFLWCHDDDTLVFNYRVVVNYRNLISRGWNGDILTEEEDVSYCCEWIAGLINHRTRNLRPPGGTLAHHHLLVRRFIFFPLDRYRHQLPLVYRSRTINDKCDSPPSIHCMLEWTDQRTEYKKLSPENTQKLQLHW